MRTIIIAIVFSLAYSTLAYTLPGWKAPEKEDMQSKIKTLQDQLISLQQHLDTLTSQDKDDSRKILSNDWQPQKRMVQWQPMKRNLDERQSLLHAIEARLSEVLRAGERLGISPDEVLQDLRFRNQPEK
ncbi:unnamed protein product [Cylicocyclus nassatus]|uniref:Uncharacterized protein n=1 Tax=Cylicocyclus nassatus TaxID=53992 RepID=A0AA36GQ52_CYLNA|nr:unnamed protein product [Cylicocyclus nassatus]